MVVFKRILIRSISLLAVMAFILLQVSCDQIKGRFTGGDQQEVVETPQAVDSGFQESIMLTRVDQLRIRNYPNIKSNIVTTLDDNMPVRYMGEETDFVETIGKVRGNWKRVKTLNGIHEGWVYSGPGFVEWMVTPLERDSLSQAGRGLKVFGNLTKPEFAKLTGSSLSGQPVGTRYSGWYTFQLGEDPAIINDKVRVIARKLDTKNKKVVYLDCSLDIAKGMPQSELQCEEFIGAD